jgi:hypothetical protein
MSVFALTDPRHLIHVSDDGWLTRCGRRAEDAADLVDVVTHRECKTCHYDKGTQ